MKLATLGAAVLAGALTAACLPLQASAASPVTNAFLANLTQNVDFLDRSSRMALDHSSKAALRDFAHSEAREQTLAANALDEWIDASKAPAVVASADPDQLQTGRSVAVDPAPQQPQLADARVPMGQEDLDMLDGLSGSEFDKVYKQKQLDALKQIAADYSDYILNGDDLALKQIATRELPKVERRIKTLLRM